MAFPCHRAQKKLNNIRDIVITAIIAGVLAGLALSLVQQLRVVPLVLEVESHKTENRQVNATVHPDNQTQPSPHATVAVWANMLTGTAFALLLAMAYKLRGNISLFEGLLWGLAGVTVFFVVPAIGMPPELANIAAVPLNERQTWWWLAVSCSAVALTLMFLQRRRHMRFLGAVLLFIPFLSGAPEAPHLSQHLSSEMSQRFLYAAAQANGVFWVVLGLVSAAVYRWRMNKTV